MLSGFRPRTPDSAMSLVGRRRALRPGTDRMEQVDAEWDSGPVGGGQKNDPPSVPARFIDEAEDARRIPMNPTLVISTFAAFAPAAETLRKSCNDTVATTR
jgi:hypothetical protein